MKLSGKITISRTAHSREPDSVTIRISDARAGVEFLEVSMTMEEFGQAVTGLGGRECHLDLGGLHLLGKVREHKREMVEFSGRVLTAELGVSEEARRALQPYEVDGWRGNPGDLGNHHRRVGSTTFSVSFERWVEAPEPPEKGGAG